MKLTKMTVVLSNNMPLGNSSAEQWRGRVAVVTGAASGIGKALAQRFAAAGIDLVLADVEAGPLQRVAGELGALAVPTDVGQPNQVEALARATLDRFGRVDALCNNAGVVGGAGHLPELGDDDWRWVFDVNLFGTVNAVRAFLPHLLENEAGGRIVHTASDAGLMAMPLLPHYCASKAAMISFSESVALELQRLGRDDIRVSVLLPGPVHTRFGESGRHRPERFGAHPEQTRDAEVLAAIDSVAMTPEVVADFAFDAMVEGRFWVPMHTRNAAPLQRRLDELIAAMPSSD